MEFRDFRELMRKQFKKVEKLPMFVVDTQKNELYDVYISSFAEADQQGHRCNSCRQFIENFGGVVAIDKGKLVSIWDFEGGTGEYINTAKVLADFVRTKPIYGPFVAKQVVLGIESNRELKEGGHVHTWNHFHHVLPTSVVDRSSNSIEKIVGDARTAVAVYKRGLTELKADAVQDVLDLIEENNLYRGAQFKNSLVAFKKQQTEYNELKTDTEREMYLWSNYKTGASIRNTAIGTLLIDLSADEDLEKSVRKFEPMMDPTRYNHTTSVVSKKQIEEAKKMIADLSVETAT